MQFVGYPLLTVQLPLTNYFNQLWMGHVDHSVLLLKIYIPPEFRVAPNF